MLGFCCEKLHGVVSVLLKFRREFSIQLPSGMVEVKFENEVLIKPKLFQNVEINSIAIKECTNLAPPILGIYQSFRTPVCMP